MRSPRWAVWLLRRAAPSDAVDEVLGDLDEAHADRVARHGSGPATFLTAVETLDMAAALVRARIRRRRTASGGTPPLRGLSLLDFKLGLRMLIKYPGLTVVGGLAMAFAIWVGAGTFELLTQAVSPRLPLPEGERVVGLWLYDVEAAAVESQALHDVVSWRQELRTIEDIGAFRTVRRNLTIETAGTEPVEVAEISASGFRVARTRPLVGRTLLDSDERPGAAPVAVIGYELWQRRFGGDPSIVGRMVRLGRTPVTVVGVMPDEFEFPVSHELWVPLRLDVAGYERREGPGLRIFGRLTPGATLERAQVEIAAAGARAAAAFPDTHEHLRPEVMPYARSIVPLSGVESALIMSGNLFLIMLLVLICANVALLMFARAATRESEIVVRTALGASRGRIVAQLFTEALVLGTVAMIVGLAATGYGLGWAFGVVEAELLERTKLPFWFHPDLSLRTVLYAAVLTLIGAAVAGVLPALKVTRGLQARLRETAAGGGLGFGGVWTVVIVAQIAVTVAFPVTAFSMRQQVAVLESRDVGYADSEYLTARLEMDREIDGRETDQATDEQFAARVEQTYAELARRLEADPIVAGVTYADRLPRMYFPHRLIELDGGGSAPRDPRWDWPGYRVSSSNVDPDHFGVLGIPLVAGRGFSRSDIDSEHGVVIVNQIFVDRILGGRNPVGRRLRFTSYEEWDGPRQDAEPLPWHEIIGVVGAGDDTNDFDTKAARIFHPASPSAAYPLQLAVHVNGATRAFGPRLREIASAVDPTLRVYDPAPADQLDQTELMFYEFWFRLIALVSTIALLLSLAGIYAVMSFTVSRRTREIGIRVALGSDPVRVVTAILSRPLTQVALGIVAGAALVAALLSAASGGVPPLKELALLAAYAVLMTAVCMLACVVPTRRALGVQPTEAMRADG